MHDISNNPHLQIYMNSKRDFSLNSYIFNEYVIEKCVTRTELISAMRNLLLKLHFNIQLNGCNYLANLTSEYFISSQYDELSTIKKLSDRYGVETTFIYASIADAIKVNDLFIPKATHLLNSNSPLICTKISDAVEIIAAIFKIYYNYVVESEEDNDSDKLSLLKIKRSILNGN